MMTVIKLSDGKILIHGVVQMTKAVLKEVQALGSVSYVFVPNSFHRLDAGWAKRIFPQAQFYGPIGGKKRIEEVVKLAGTYEDFPQHAEITVTYLRGCKKREAILAINSGDGVTLISNDVIFSHHHLGGAVGILMRLLRSTGERPRVTPIARIFLVAKKQRLRDHLLELAATANLRRLVIMHCRVVASGASEFLRTAASSL